MAEQFTFRVLAKDLGKMERKLLREYPIEIQKSLKSAGGLIVRLLKERTVALGVWDRGKMYRGWRSKAEPKKLAVFNTEPHAVYVEHGRRAGARMPPVTPILMWVYRHLGVADPKQARSIAFAIAKSIARRGIAARPILTAEGATEEFAKVTLDAIAKGLDRAHRKSAR